VRSTPRNRNIASKEQLFGVLSQNVVHLTCLACPHSGLLLESGRFGGFPAGRSFLQALIDHGDFVAPEAVERINKLVDLGFQDGNIIVGVSLYVATSKNSKATNDQAVPLGC
jgi:hypothetical protein